jgi:hypothetical protein
VPAPAEPVLPVAAVEAPPLAARAVAPTEMGAEPVLPVAAAMAAAVTAAAADPQAGTGDGEAEENAVREPADETERSAVLMDVDAPAAERAEATVVEPLRAVEAAAAEGVVGMAEPTAAAAAPWAAETAAGAWPADTARGRGGAEADAPAAASPAAFGAEAGPANGTEAPAVEPAEAAAVADIAHAEVTPMPPPARPLPAEADLSEAVGDRGAANSAAGQPAAPSRWLATEGEPVAAIAPEPTSIAEPLESVAVPVDAERLPVTAVTAAVASAAPVEPATGAEPAAREEAAADVWANEAGGSPEARPGVASGPQGGFRVVAPSEIIILPPEPVHPAGGTAARPFRSEFWADEEPPGEAAAPADDDEPQLFPNGGGPAGTHMRSVQEAEPPVDDNTWLAALERDLFGGPAEPPRPNEEPPPTPQPIETPQPQEDPVPPAQPIETPQPQEDPLPPAQPIETPQPQEVPGTPQPPPQPSPPAAPPTRAHHAADEEVD